ncbi:MAG: PD40 domain-containing protein [Aridibacter famidurans]|nr:PD40 domain-containing protein [Aridibacter famidurans]
MSFGSINALPESSATPFFIPNRGQWAEEVRFAAQAAGQDIFFLDSEVAIFPIVASGSAPKSEETIRKRPASYRTGPIRLKFEGPAQKVTPDGELPRKGRMGFFKGNDPSKWAANVPVFGKLAFRDIYEGVDLVFYGTDGELQYDFVVDAGTSPESIGFRVEGAGSPIVNPEGELVVSHGKESLKLTKPVAYQIGDSGERTPVDAAFRVTDESIVRFDLGEFDPSKELVIDPVISFSSFLGGMREDIGNSIAVDQSGGIYIAGSTISLDYPVTPESNPQVLNTDDIFVTKLTPDGSDFEYSLVLGSNLDDYANDIALDAQGNAYVVGKAGGINFPVFNSLRDLVAEQAPGAELGGFGGIVFKINQQGTGIVYAYEYGVDNTAVAIDADGRAHIAGTTSCGTCIPLNSPLMSHRGRRDGYIGILDPDGFSLQYSTYYGGAEDDYLEGIDVDDNGNIYLTGLTWSNDFPAVNAYQPKKNGGVVDLWVAKLTPGGTEYVYSTYLGGSDYEESGGIAADAEGNAYIAGGTRSVDFPVGETPPIEPFSGIFAACAAKLSADGSTLVYSTTFGGLERDFAHDIAVNGMGEAVLVGETKSADFPVHRSAKHKSGLHKSGDGGKNWRNNFEVIEGEAVNVVEIDPTDSSRVYAGTERGIWKSTDHGETWTNTSSGLVALWVADLEVDPSNPNVVYAGVRFPGGELGPGGGVYKSINGGASWTLSSNGIPSSVRNILSIELDPNDPNLILAGTANSLFPDPLFRSTDGGSSWFEVGHNIAVSVSDIEFDPSNSSIVYATGGDSRFGFFKSTNQGLTWQISSSGIPEFSRLYSVAVHPFNPNVLYAGVSGGMYRSTNAGASWQEVFDLPNSRAQLVFDPFDPSRIYAASQLGFYIATANGTVWTKVGGGLKYETLVALEADPNRQGVLFTGAVPGKEFDGFVTKINSAGNGFVYSSLFGSHAVPEDFPLEFAFGVAYGPTGSVYATGWTRHPGFPTTPGAFSNHYSGEWDAFVTRFDDSRSLRGTVTGGSGQPVQGVAILVSGTNELREFTGADGIYRFDNLTEGGSFAVTPFKIGTNFTPESVLINGLNEDTVANFTSGPAFRTISGQVVSDGAPLGDVTVTLSGTANSVAQTGAAGSYSFSVPNGGDYEVSVSRSGYIFEPASVSFDKLFSDAVADFSASAGYIISGQVTLNGSGLMSVPVRVTGAAGGTKLTDGEGRFLFQLPAGGSYTVFAESGLYRFSPGSYAFEDLDSSAQISFSASAPLAASGRIALSSHSFLTTPPNIDIFVIEGSELVNLTASPEDDYEPAWSPDGRKIAFASIRDGNWEIYVMNADGSQQTRLTNDFAVDRRPSWSPSGEFLIFESRPGGTSSSEIYRMRADGSELAQITNNSFYEHSAKYSPDGNLIVFVSEQDGNAEIYVMNADGGNRKRLTTDPETDSDPAWSPDGSRIVFARGFQNAKELYLIDRNGSNELRLTQNQWEDMMPEFSPDGTKIVFVTTFECSNYDIFTMNADGSGRTQVTKCGGSDTQPTWEPVASGRAPFDFDGDGATDVSVFRPNSQPTAQWWLLRSSDSGTRGLAFGTSTDVPVAADFTGDGKTDVAFWRPSTGEWFILRSEDDSFFAFPFGANGDIPAPGDFDGDGKADPAIYRPSSGTWFIVRSSDGGLSVVPFGVAADQPIVADYDGDGKDDIGVYRAPDNQFWLFRSTDGVKAFQFGAPGDRTAVGDWTGDGKADVAFFRPSSSEWYVIRSEDDSFFAFPWGATGDVPSPGDFDGDGKFDPAVWRPSDRTWYIFGTTSGFEAVQFGSNGDVPLPSSVSVN